MPALLLALQRAAGNQAVTAAVQRQVFKPRSKYPKPPKPPKPPTPKPQPKPAPATRLDWQKMVVTPIGKGLALVKKGPANYKAAAEILNNAGHDVAKFDDRTRDDPRDEVGNTFQLQRLLYSLFWELQPRKQRSLTLPADFADKLLDHATWIEKALTTRAPSVPKDDTALGGWKDSFTKTAQKIAADVKANGLPKTATDIQILINDLEHMRAMTTLVRSLVGDDRALQVSMAAAAALVTEYFQDASDAVAGPHDVGTIVGHIHFAADLATELSPIMTKIR